MGKRYYWLKLKEDFFESKRIKKLRKLAGGDTFLIIYLKMQLMAMKGDGFIKYTGLEKSFAEELALDLDEDADNVAVTIQYLMTTGLIETSDDINYFLPYSIENTGSETAAAQRVRECRARQEVLHCNTSVTQVKQNVTQVKQNCNGEIEIEIEKDKEIEERKQEKKERRFTPPSVSEVKKYCLERGNTVDAEEFVDFYASKGWKIGKNAMKDWKAAVRTWEKRRKGEKPQEDNVSSSFDTDEFIKAALNRKFDD